MICAAGNVGLSFTIMVWTGKREGYHVHYEDFDGMKLTIRGEVCPWALPRGALRYSTLCRDRLSDCGYDGDGHFDDGEVDIEMISAH